MDLKQLRYFCKVAETNSMTRASDEVYISQPALGMQIKRLEEELDVTLFTRHSRGVTLTSAGRLLKSHADEILKRVEIAKQELRRYRLRPSGTVRVGVTPALGSVLAPNLLEICFERTPEIHLSFVQGFSPRLDKLFQQERLDLTFSHTSLAGDPRVLSFPVFWEKLYLVGSTESAADLPSPIPFRDIIPLSILIDSRSQRTQEMLLEAAAAVQLEFENLVLIESINIRREMVLGGRGFGVVPLALFAKEIDAGAVRALEISDMDLSGNHYLNSRASESMTPAESTVHDMILELVEASLQSAEHGWKRPVVDASEAVSTE